MSEKAASAPESEKPAKNALREGAEAFIRTIAGWGTYLATTLMVDAFLFFESTIDVRIYGMEKLLELKRAGQNPLLVIWHGQGLLPMTTLRHERLCLYASHTREEHYARSLQILRWWTLRFVERMGYRVLDAAQFKSESRGVMQFVEILRSGTGSVIAADGPAGPIYQAKPGPAFLAKKAGVTLVPVGAAISQGFQLDQWDRFAIPWPFSAAVIVLGDPITVPATAKDEALEACRLALETEMRRRMQEAAERLNLPVSQPTYQVEAERA